MRPSTRSSRPARANFAAISKREELEAIRHGTPSRVVASSACRAPGIGVDFDCHHRGHALHHPVDPDQDRGSVRDTFRPPPGYRQMSGRGTGDGIPRLRSASRPRAIRGRRRGRPVPRCRSVRRRSRRSPGRGGLATWRSSRDANAVIQQWVERRGYPVFGRSGKAQRPTRLQTRRLHDRSPACQKQIEIKTFTTRRLCGPTDAERTRPRGERRAMLSFAYQAFGQTTSSVAIDGG